MPTILFHRSLVHPIFLNHRGLLSNGRRAKITKLASKGLLLRCYHRVISGYRFLGNKNTMVRFPVVMSYSSDGTDRSSRLTLEQKYEQDRVLKYSFHPSGENKGIRKINDNLQSTWVMTAMSYILPKGFPVSVGSNYEKYIAFQAIDGEYIFLSYMDICIYTYIPNSMYSQIHFLFIHTRYKWDNMRCFIYASYVVCNRNRQWSRSVGFIWFIKLGIEGWFGAIR